MLDETAVQRARNSLEDSAVAARMPPWREQIVDLLNAALATELVCNLRYKRHRVTTGGLYSPAMAAEFTEHALDETEPADRIAQRIAQLGGAPHFNPQTLLDRRHADYDESTDLLTS